MALAAIALGLAVTATAARGGPVLPEVLVALHATSTPTLPREAVEDTLLTRLREALEGSRLSIVRASELGLGPRVLDACADAGALACWVRAASDLGDRRPGLIVNAAVSRGAGGRWSVALLLIPTDAATLELVRGAPDGDALEEALFAQSTSAELALDQGDARGWRALTDALTARLHAHDPSLSVGALVVESEGPGLIATLDGLDVGVLDDAGRLVVRRLARGSYSLHLIDPRDVERADPQIVRVETGSVTVARVTLRPRERPLTPLLGGVALAAAGAALIAYATVAPSDRDLCRPRCAPRFVTFGEGSGGGSGVMIAPLGYGLALAGATWALSPLALPRSELATWLGLGLGLALGGAAYAISAAAGG